jgi:hypothetical protein
LFAGELVEVGGDLAADRGDPGAIGLGEDVLLALGEVDVGEGLAEGVGDFGEHELLLAVRAEENDMGHGHGLAGEDIAPGVVGFLFDGGMDGALEREIVGEGRMTHGKGKAAEMKRTSGWKTAVAAEKEASPGGADEAASRRAGAGVVAR